MEGGGGLNIINPCEYVYIYIFIEMDVIGVMEPVQGCPLLASSVGTLWDTFSKGCPSFSRGFTLGKPCREAPEAAAHEDARALGAWHKDAAEQLDWFSHRCPNKNPSEAHEPALQGVWMQAWKRAFILSAHPLLPPHLPAMQFPAKSSWSPISHQHPAGRRQTRPSIPASLTLNAWENSTCASAGG